ncbi:ribonuclease H [Senna tora]|uniref:Ribonuclease H n=1 Tax=Senna tora TaxID=362788 RepID=A0A834VYC4_9FABA|nr:ribonuclease H [Senna tora]
MSNTLEESENVIDKKEVIKDYVDTSPPNPEHGPDAPMWTHGKDGLFTVNCAYCSIREFSTNSSHSSWNQIWKGNMQYMHKFFIWRLKHESLPTRCKIARWSSVNPLCPLCESHRETNLHIIRDCHKIATIWKSFVKPKDISIFLFLPMKEWITWNLRNKEMTNDLPWYLIFATTCNLIWSRRNKCLHSDDFNFPNEPGSIILRHANNQAKAWENDNQRITKVTTSPISSWVNPPEGWVKISSDEAVCRSSNIVGCGGLICDHSGQWIQGFKKKIGFASPLSAELWGIYHGLKLAWDLGFRRIELENESRLAIDLCKSTSRSSQSSYPAVKGIKELINKSWVVKFFHISRSRNICADILAKSSLAYSGGVNILIFPPVIVFFSSEFSYSTKASCGEGLEFMAIPMPLSLLISEYVPLYSRSIPLVALLLLEPRLSPLEYSDPACIRNNSCPEWHPRFLHSRSLRQVHPNLGRVGLENFGEGAEKTSDLVLLTAYEAEAFAGFSKSTPFMA